MRRRFSEFKLLHDKLQKELLVVPGFPSADVSYKVGLGDYAARGKALCRYACRVQSLGARGACSLALTSFLEIAPLGYTSRRTAAAPRRPAVTSSRRRVRSTLFFEFVPRCSTPRPGVWFVWHMVDEFWLKRWRKFVLGRAARRYEPPGPITNEHLLESVARTRYLMEEGMTVEERKKRQKELDEGDDGPATDTQRGSPRVRPAVPRWKSTRRPSTRIQQGGTHGSGARHHRETLPSDKLRPLDVLADGPRRCGNRRPAVLRCLSRSTRVVSGRAGGGCSLSRPYRVRVRAENGHREVPRVA